MDLIKLTDHCYYLKGGVNIGLINLSQNCILIDAGIDKQTAKNIEKIINTNNWQLSHIINTHAHADHFGGSQYLKDTYNAKILAPKIEGIIMEYPIYEPLYLYGGAYPINELKNKFLQGPPTTIDEYLSTGSISIYDKSIEIVSLPGHTIGQIGVFFDDVLYLADAAFGPEVLKKHGVPYFVDIDLQLKTLDYLETLKYNYYVPAHGEVTSNIKELTRANRQYIYDITNKIRQLLPGTCEEIVAGLLNSLKIKINNPGQYFLMRAATLAHISYLNNSGEITWEIISNLLKWKKKTSPDKHPAHT